MSFLMILGVLLNSVFVLHFFNLWITMLYHYEAARISGYPEGIDTMVQPHLSMENPLFGLTYTCLIVMVHLALSGSLAVWKTRSEVCSGD